MFTSLMADLPLIGRFAIIFAILLVLPRIAQKLGLPGVLGLIVGGVLMGPALLGMVDEHQKVIELFAELGKLLLMFYAGREIDLNVLKKVGGQAMGYGVITSFVPMAAGFGAALCFGYSMNASVLIGSVLASHTLLGLPIVKQLGLASSRPVIVTVAATVLTDIVSLLTLAVCVSVHKTGFSPEHLVKSLVGLAVYAPLVVFGLSWLAKWLFAHGRLSHESKFAVMLLMVAAGAWGAELIELEGIVGAFLTGIAVRRAIPDEKFEEPLHAVAQSLFIPVFFLSVGLLVDLKVLWGTIKSEWLLVLAITGALVGGKALAAWWFGAMVRYSKAVRGLVWSLSIPQVAATLASALVGYATVNAAGERLFDERVLNTMVVLVVVSSVLGPLATQWYGKKVVAEMPPGEAGPEAGEPGAAAESVGGAQSGHA